MKRFWGILEQHWNGTLLNTVETVLNWASTATWRGTPAIIHEITDLYDRGVRIARSAFRPIADRVTFLDYEALSQVHSRAFALSALELS